MTITWPERLRASEAAQYLRVSRSTLSKWRTRRVGPPWHQCGPRLIIYLKHELDGWLAGSGRQETDPVDTSDSTR